MPSLSPLTIAPSEAIRHAAVLWQYFSSFRARKRCEALIVCCSYDLRVCQYACDLYRQGLAPLILFSGKRGNWTEHLWSETEAQVFSRVAREYGVPESAILLEPNATNFGENVAFSRKLLGPLRSAVFLTKPNAALRLSLVVEKLWKELDFTVDGPNHTFPEGVSNVVGLYGLIEEMVGDVQRIQHYPALGFQASHKLPESVIRSYEFLVAKGFTGHLIK
ncbi:YdcF family protein [Enterobacterales bacterium AE_CKDN230030158-1A_HGKHYDSX7]